MSIAEFYISNGIDPWNPRALERWIGSNIGFSTRRSHDLKLSEFRIDRIGEKEGWEKLEPDDGAEFALDQNISFRKERHELSFYLDTQCVQSREVYCGDSSLRSGGSGGGEGNVVPTTRVLYEKAISMKYVPTIFEDPTDQNFDAGRIGLVGQMSKWKRTYGFVKTFYQTGGTKNEYFLHESEISSQLKCMLSSRPYLGGIYIIFDTRPVKGKLDRAVNVRLWRGNHASKSFENSTPPPKKKRKVTHVSMTEDELLFDLKETDQEMRRDLVEEEEQIKESSVCHYMNVYYDDLRDRENESLVHFAEQTKQELRQDQVEEEEQFEEGLVFHYMNVYYNDLRDRENVSLVHLAEQTKQELRQDLVEEEEQFEEGLVFHYMNVYYNDLRDRENVSLVHLDEQTKQELRQDQVEEEEQFEEGLVFHYMNVYYDGLRDRENESLVHLAKQNEQKMHRDQCHG